MVFSFRCVTLFNLLCSFVSVFIVLALAQSPESLPFCELSNTLSQIVLVSTLDGRITALNPENGGTALWSLYPGNEPLLSSSIHRLELTNYGQLVRMIPSLNGGLYKFNGETIEAIPLTAEHLLQASFRYSDELVISGGKESQTLGVSLRTGEVVYECTMKGCKDDGGAAAPSGDVLLVQRSGQVVRAVEPRSGVERWNFSVAQHDLKLLSECHGSLSSNALPSRINLKVIVPDGLIFAMDNVDQSRVLWQYQFESPIVNTWEIHMGKVFEVDLFGREILQGDYNPSLYIGMHEKQLYIQESVMMIKQRQKLALDFGKNLITYEAGPNRLPWRPVAANSQNVGLPTTITATAETSEEETPATALSILYASPYVDGRGFYLYNNEAIEMSEKAQCNASISDLEKSVDEPLDEEATPVTIVIVSLWFWWREVTVISVTTALLFNYVFIRRYLRSRSLMLLPVATVSKSQTDSGVIIDEVRKASESHSDDYESRYLSDFDPVHCLGKGGFGVVFEAKNKIDDCHYAIKRIVLPDAPESRERVMREVRALAKLDHNNIVRYFNSWLESPPPGWQRTQDLQFINKNDCSQFSDFGSETVTDCYPPLAIKYVEEDKMECSSQEIALPSYEQHDVSDSFIVFASDSKSSTNCKSDSGHNADEHSIAIPESRTESREDELLQNSKQKKMNVWSEHSTLCQSPRKVYLYIQMQLCRKESLKDWLQQNETRNYSTVIHVFEQIVRAVDYVHCRNLIHRDLKPSNIFFSMEHQIKVGDFGLVTTIADELKCPTESEDGVRRHTSQVGTQLYMSPEQLRGQSYSFKVDIFSLGLILFELLVPFATQMERLKLLQEIKNNNFPIDFRDNYVVEHKLLEKMLAEQPDERPDTKEILRAPPLSQNQENIADKKH